MILCCWEQIFETCHFSENLGADVSLVVGKVLVDVEFKGMNFIWFHARGAAGRAGIHLGKAILSIKTDVLMHI